MRVEKATLMLKDEDNMTDIPIDIERGEHGLFYGTSKVMKGLLVTGKTIREVVDKAPQAIEEMRAAAAAVQEPPIAPV